MKLAELAGRKVAILGAGREGQACWKYLRDRLPEQDLALVSEAPPDRVFADRLTARDTMVVERLSKAGLDRFEVLIRSPGISPYRFSIRHARRAGARVTTSNSLWFSEHPRAQTICITGTKGKSTTSALLAHALRGCGLKVGLAGNIGRPLIECEPRGEDFWVIELSSYQLVDLEARPGVAVFLNLSPEHLDWHGGEARYVQDKLRLADLAAENPLVVNAADALLSRAFSGRSNVTWFNDRSGFRVEAHALWEGEKRLAFDPPDSLPGAHNLANAAAALTAARVVGADTGRALQSFRSFVSLPHRLQKLGERRGLEFINDSISSTPVATVAALETLKVRWITLIVGGLDRGVDWNPHFEAIRQASPGAVIGIPDNGGKVIDQMSTFGFHPSGGLHACANLEEAVEKALELTPDGGVVLLSPGAPSFPQFQDFEDRGRQFARLCGFDLIEKPPSGVP